MKIVVPVLVAASLAGCASRSPEIGRWCGADPPGEGIAVDLPEVSFRRIREGRVRAARRMLAKESLVEISLGRFADMARRPADHPVAGHFYVARAGIMLPPNSSDDDVGRLSDRFDFLFSHNRDPLVLNIVSATTSEAPLTPIDYPILVTAPRPYRAARVVCLAAR